MNNNDLSASNFNYTRDKIIMNDSSITEVDESSHAKLAPISSRS
jgi:hypothetical protein